MVSTSLLADPDSIIVDIYPHYASLPTNPSLSTIEMGTSDLELPHIEIANDLVLNILFLIMSPIIILPTSSSIFYVRFLCFYA